MSEEDTLKWESDRRVIPFSFIANPCKSFVILAERIFQLFCQSDNNVVGLGRNDESGMKMKKQQIKYL